MVICGRKEKITNGIFFEILNTIVGWNLMVNIFQLILMYWIASAIFNIRDDIQKMEKGKHE